MSLDHLSPKKRVVFVLHEIEGREPKEIAEHRRRAGADGAHAAAYARKEFYARAGKEQVFSPAGGAS